MKLTAKLSVAAMLGLCAAGPAAPANAIADPNPAADSLLLFAAPAADKAAPDKSVPDKAAPDKAVPDKTAPDKPATDKPATDKPAAEKTAAPQAAVQPVVPRPATAPATRPSPLEHIEPAPPSSGDLFNPDRVWTIQLEFTAAQFDALEPKPQAQQPGFNRQRENDLGPARLIVPSMLRDGDTDKDGRLGKEEFSALAEKWFADWDKDKSGKLTNEKLVAGMNATFPNVTRMFNLQGPQGGRNGLAASNGVNFDYVHANISIADKSFKDVAVRYKGNGTWMASRGTQKHSLKIEFNQWVKGQKFVGLTKLNLHNNVSDPSWMNEPLSYRLYRDAGVPSPRTSYARVYITVPGRMDHAYLGLYSVVEDIDKSFEHEVMDTKKGAILKPVTPELFADLGDDWKSYSQTYDPKDDLSDKQKARIIGFCKFVTSATDAEFAAHIGDWLDLDEFARYMGATVYLSTLDSLLALGQNFYVYLDAKSGKFQFLPWDLDHSFGNFGFIGSDQARANLSIMHPWRGENRFLDRVYATDAFKKVYLARLNEFNKSIFAPQRFFAQVDRTFALIHDAVQDESPRKLASLEQVARGTFDDMSKLVDGKQPGMLARALWGQGTPPIKAFVIPRSRSIADQLAGKSNGEVLESGGFGDRPRNPRPGAGAFLGNSFMAAVDTNKDGQATHAEFLQAFNTLFPAWDADKDGKLSEAELREGVNRDMSPLRPRRDVNPRDNNPRGNNPRGNNLRGNNPRNGIQLRSARP